MTKFLPSTKTLILVAKLTLLAGIPHVFTSCRSDDETTGENTDSVALVDTLHKNSLVGQQSRLIESQMSSPIHWQNWDENLFKLAKSERKTIFALIGSGTDANTHEILATLNNSPSSCSLLNSHHVNALIDSNIHPDINYFVAMLCLKSRAPMDSPFLIWFSYEGKPISWSPVYSNANKNINELLNRMSNTVHQVWRDDPEYVLKNSQQDFDRRMKSPLPTPVKDDTDNARLVVKAVRHAASLFDPTSNTIDGLGNLTTARYIDLMLQAARHPDISETQRNRYINIASESANDILLRGLVDPLDGGIFSGVQKSTSALPVFTKTLRAQTLSMKALYGLYQTTSDKHYLLMADSIMAYTEKNFLMKDGGYISGITYGSTQAQDNPCVWTLEEIEAALTPDEFKIATRAFGLRGLGNIPLIDDPNRSYFRKNTLTWKTSKQDLAALLSIDAASLRTKLESITKKLAKLRIEKQQNRKTEDLCTAASMAHLACAYIAGFRATGKTDYLTKAQATLAYIKGNFTGPSGELRRARFAGILNRYPATAADYALVCQAALDLHEVSLDPDWLDYSYQLHKNMNEKLAEKDTYLIREYHGEGYPATFNTHVLYTLQPLDNDSTWSIAFSNAKRLSMRFADDALTTQQQNLGKYLSGLAQSLSIPCIDYLTLQSVTSQPVVHIKPPVDPELLQAAARQPCQIILLQPNGSYPQLGKKADSQAPGSATVVIQGKIAGTVNSANDLEAMLK